MPQPLDSVLRGEVHPYDRGATKCVGTEIVAKGKRLVCLAVWDNGDRSPVDWAVCADEDGAWYDAILDDRWTKAQRRQALDRLIELTHESHRYDCADC